jgi:energy-coupling factor transporter ATP-binding protein EcfA2
MPQIAEFHKRIFEVLKSIKEQTIIDFNFTLRDIDEQRNNATIYLFDGNENAVSFSFWEGRDTKSRDAYTINCEISNFEEPKFNIYVNAKDSREKGELFVEFINYIYQSIPFTRYQNQLGGAEYQWRRNLSNENFEKALKKFVLYDRPFINSVLEGIKKNNQNFDYLQAIHSQDFYAKCLKIITFLRNENKIVIPTSTIVIHKQPICLTNLQLENIGHFQNLELDLGKRVVCLIGENGSGKSTILRAIGLGLIGDDSKSEFIDAEEAKLFPTIVNTKKDEHNRLALTYKGIGRITLKYKINSAQENARIVEFVQEAIKEVPDRYTLNSIAEDEKFSPTFFSNGILYLSDFVLGFPQSNKHKNKGFKGIKEPNIFDILPLILEYDDQRMKSFIKWTYDKLQAIKENIGTEAFKNHQNYKEVMTVFNIIYKITQDNNKNTNNSITENPLQIKDFYKDENDEPKLIVSTPDSPNGIPLDIISQGYNSVFGWVGKLVSRLFEVFEIQEEVSNNFFLQGIFLHKTVAYTAWQNIFDIPATVIIDEIDTYLHPKWQENILNVLIAEFPKIRFIVTTHSELVLSALDKENVYAIKIDELTQNYVAEHPFGEIYGSDSTSLLKTIDAPVRYRKVEEQLDEISNTIEIGTLEALEKAENLMLPLEERNPLMPELAIYKMRIRNKKAILNR